ncbi:MAG TPA: DUF4397 domain-containing protein, partial [Candidatus Baltobacteraceae bacterium]|nr:DUF4397 domain-containing protein [Candidatus Baltobacteraceae bacterium]
GGIFSIAGLAGCNGGTSTSPFSPSSSKAQVRFVNGSPDAGAIEVFIDNQQQYCTNGATGSACALNYGSVTSYAVSLNAGSHAVILRDSNGTQINIPNFSGALSVNAGSKYSIVLAGAVHPTYASSPTLTVTTINEEPFPGGAAVNFHQSSPYVQQINGAGGVQFGYYTGTTPSANPLGQPAAFGSATNPQTLPSAAQNVPITFYAMSPTSGITVTPSQISTSCASNAMPCSTGNLSLYLIDGPAATTTPPTTLPTGVSPTANAIFVGTFD